MVDVGATSLIDEVVVESGTNISIGCPGITRNTFVVQLEWRCKGQCGDKKRKKTAANSAGEHSLLKYVKDQGKHTRLSSLLESLHGIGQELSFEIYEPGSARVRTVRPLTRPLSTGTTSFKSKGRLSLDSEMFGLEFDPVRPVDSGRYMCLINNRPKPDAVIQMNVLGE